MTLVYKRILGGSLSANGDLKNYMQRTFQIFGQYRICIFYLKSREKSLRHVAMVAKFLDDNKPKTSLKKWIHTVTNFIDLIQFHLICQMLAKFSGVKSERIMSKLTKKEKKIVKLCSPTPYSRHVKFHATVVQRRLRNVQESAMHVQSFVLLIWTYWFFCRSRCRRRRRFLSALLLWTRNFASMVTWRQTSPLYTEYPKDPC